jgi:hypothetical protein
MDVRFYILVLMAALITVGCDTQPKEILVASTPSQASVKVNQAEVGLTPFTIKVQQDITIVVSKLGYKPHTAVLSSTDDPNLIITLEEEERTQVNSSMIYPPTEDQITTIDGAQQFQTLIQDPQAEQPKEILIASKPSNANVRLNQKEMGTTPIKIIVQKNTILEVSKSGYQTSSSIVSSLNEPNLIVTLEKSLSSEKERPVAKAKSVKKPRLTIARVKQLYREGRINKFDYSAKIRNLKHRMDTDLIDLKMRYKRGSINKYDYKLRVKQIKFRYTG